MTPISSSGPGNERLVVLFRIVPFAILHGQVGEVFEPCRVSSLCPLPRRAMEL